MTECIERQTMLEDFESCNRSDPEWTPQRVKTLIVRQPPVDAVPVIRCKDCSYCRELRRNDPYENRYIEGCLWCMNISEGVMPDDYCSNAKRKESINGDKNH